MRNHVQISSCKKRFRTPLHFVAHYNRNVKVLKYLVLAGADIGAKDDSGKIPLDYADTEEKKSILREAMEVSKSVVNETKESITMSDFSYYYEVAQLAFTRKWFSSSRRGAGLV